MHACAYMHGGTVAASISHLSANGRNCGKKALGSCNWLVDLLGKVLITADRSRADGPGIFGLDLQSSL